MLINEIIKLSLRNDKDDLSWINWNTVSNLALLDEYYAQRTNYDYLRSLEQEADECPEQRGTANDSPPGSGEGTDKDQ